MICIKPESDNLSLQQEAGPKEVAAAGLARAFLAFEKFRELSHKGRALKRQTDTGAAR